MKSKLVLIAGCTNHLNDLVDETEKRGLHAVIIDDDEGEEDRINEEIKRKNPKYVLGVFCKVLSETLGKELKERGIKYIAVKNYLAGDDQSCYRKNKKWRDVHMPDYIAALDNLASQR